VGGGVGGEEIDPEIDELLQEWDESKTTSE